MNDAIRGTDTRTVKQSIRVWIPEEQTRQSVKGEAVLLCSRIPERKKTIRQGWIPERYFSRSGMPSGCLIWSGLLGLFTLVESPKSLCVWLLSGLETSFAVEVTTALCGRAASSSCAVEEVKNTTTPVCKGCFIYL